jgi:hypothetical protein
MGCSIFLTINETAAIFDASGQGLMEVRIPGHRAESSGKPVISIRLTPEIFGFPYL